MATQKGVDALGEAYEPLPTGAALREYWLVKLPEDESKILSVLMDGYPNTIERDVLTEASGFKRSTRDAYLQRLKAKQLIVIEGRGEVRAAGTLFQETVD